MTICRNLTPIITKGQKRVKKGPKRVKKLYKLKMPIEIPFMSVIFGMYTQFIYAHMTIYRNLTSKQTKDQKRVKKGSKIGQKIVKIKNAHRNTLYEYNFWHVYTIYICAYENLKCVNQFQNNKKFDYVMTKD